MLYLVIMIIFYLFLPEFFVRFLTVGSQYIYCAVRKKGNYRAVYLLVTGLSTVVIASKRVKRPSEHASADIFNTAYLWEYGANP